MARPLPIFKFQTTRAWVLFDVVERLTGEERESALHSQLVGALSLCRKHALEGYLQISSGLRGLKCVQMCTGQWHGYAARHRGGSRSPERTESTLGRTFGIEDVSLRSLELIKHATDVMLRMKVVAVVSLRPCQFLAQVNSDIMIGFTSLNLAADVAVVPFL